MCNVDNLHQFFLLMKNDNLRKKVWERLAQLASRSLARFSCLLFSSAFSSSAAEGEPCDYQAKIYKLFSF